MCLILPLRTPTALFNRAFIGYYTRDSRLRECIETFEVLDDELHLTIIDGTADTLLKRLPGLAKWLRQTGTTITTVRYNDQPWRIDTILKLAGIEDVGEGVRDKRLRKAQQQS